jgi:hypothetical protein
MTSSVQGKPAATTTRQETFLSLLLLPSLIIPDIFKVLPMS